MSQKERVRGIYGILICVNNIYDFMFYLICLLRQSLYENLLNQLNSFKDVVLNVDTYKTQNFRILNAADVLLRLEAL